MEMARGLRAKNGIVKHSGGGLEDLNSDNLLVIKLPDSRVLRVVSRSLFLAMVVDLVHEGLIREGHRALILSSGIGDPVYNLRFFNIFSSGFGDPVYNLGFFNDNEIEIVPESDLEHSGFIPDEKFDIVFASSFRAIKFVDPLIKTGGILALHCGCEETVEGNEELNSSTKRGLCANALSGQEGSIEGLPTTNIHQCGLQGRKQCYNGLVSSELPEKESRFVIYNLEIDGQPGSLMPQMGKATNVGISGWLMENVKEEEYVVMKAEAEVVEEMIKGRIVCLVDELFLGCNHQRQKGENNKQRAYWECLPCMGG
ncbi:hypothetical protein CK203_015232 [Vitis vinifera]|uniref:DUF7870 domain-containing protein n=1 Tax=Vitis vinifera TaxID=29760 RepID=A0A438JK86_VITVI|nr:hypothetical protein CK203_015232 [Vitis vinifera]